VSRRKRDLREPTGDRASDADGREAGGVLGDPAPDASGREPGRVLPDLAVLLLAFGAGVGVAELFGAANLGVAFGVGQITFAIAVVVLLTRG
jgi:hypothetical protein